jgi:hypothetical protein
VWCHNPQGSGPCENHPWKTLRAICVSMNPAYRESFTKKPRLSSENSTVVGSLTLERPLRAAASCQYLRITTNRTRRAPQPGFRNDRQGPSLGQGAVPQTSRSFSMSNGLEPTSPRTDDTATTRRPYVKPRIDALCAVRSVLQFGSPPPPPSRDMPPPPFGPPPK